MSRICFCVLYGARERYCEMISEIEPLLHKYSIFLFHNIDYNESFFDRIDKNNATFFSIADNPLYDNCEQLLLPDNCSVNGFKNPIPFLQRMKMIQDILSKMRQYCSGMELFVGDSGCGYEEFEKRQISICDFTDNINCMNTPNPPDVHYVFT